MSRRVPIVTLALLLVGIAFLPGPFATRGQYERAASGIESWLRIVTCQWTHWSFNHFLWDALVFIFLGSLCERGFGRRRYVAVLVAASVAVPQAVHVLCPEIQTFRGLSGIDCALFGMLLANGFLRSLEQRRGPAAVTVAAVAALFLMKCCIEWQTRAALFVQDDLFVVVPAAHVAGFIVGLIGIVPKSSTGEVHARTRLLSADR